MTKNANDKIVKILVGNKCDLDHERMVSKNEGEMLARQFGLKYFECSAKSGLGIAECFEELIEDSYAAKYSNPPTASNNPQDTNDRRVTLTRKGDKASLEKKEKKKGCC